MKRSQVLLALAVLGLSAGVGRAAVVADFSFNGTGTAVSSNGYTATLVGAVAQSATGASGFDGNSYIQTNVPISQFNGSAANMTIQVVAALTSTTQGTWRNLVGDDADKPNFFMGFYGVPGATLTVQGSDFPGAFQQVATYDPTYRPDDLLMHNFTFEHWSAGSNGLPAGESAFAQYVDGLQSGGNVGTGMDLSAGTGNFEFGLNGIAGDSWNPATSVTILRVVISSDAVDPANFVYGAAPEPASLALLALGGMALLARRRRAR